MRDKGQSNGPRSRPGRINLLSWARDFAHVMSLSTQEYGHRRIAKETGVSSGQLDL